MHRYTPFLVASIARGASRPLYEATRLEDTVRDIFSQHGSQRYLRIGLSSLCLFFVHSYVFFRVQYLNSK
jgi:hypothetical protein